ncbi:Thioredoxin family protein [Cryptosporidium meleagridis]|uniref:Thioredoxin family protein n=1 Tax=Cryptosporidium meleagridis TaxID=93969 RepID=A0A2P4Z2Q1_9CRYT|nr:Thioredoxin family protein [Cryptosporidium meleagridis]
MFFDKGILALLMNPFRKNIKRNFFNINTFNRKYFDLFRNKDGFSFNYTIFSISISVAFLAKYYYQNTRKQLNMEAISSDEIEILSSKSKNMIVLNLIKGTKINKSNFIKELIKQIKSKELNRLNIQIYYTEKTSSEGAPNVTLFKGYGSRISNFDLNFINNIERIISFFDQKSEKIVNDKTSIIKNISYDTFESDVINKSDENNPLLLMYYDDYCLMCFLIRPLINSLAVRLRNTTNIQFGRYNIGRNDLHEFSPPVKATPTFVVFRGKQEPERLDEYKPKDIINKIIEIECGTRNHDCGKNELAELRTLEQKVLIRFHLFTILNIWNLYLKELQAKLINTPKSQLDRLNFMHLEELLSISCLFLQDQNVSSKNSKSFDETNFEKISYDKISENINFQEIFLENIKKDMKRSDTIEENIDHLLNEIEECCNDYIAIKKLIKNS